MVEHLPGFQLYSPEMTESVTVEDLLTHVVGVEHGTHLYLAPGLTRKELVHRARHLEPLRAVASYVVTLVDDRPSQSGGGEGGG